MDSWSAQARVAGRRVGVPMLGALVVLTLVSVGAGLLVERWVAAFDLSVAREMEAGRTPRLDRLTGWSTVLADSVTVAVLWASGVALAVAVAGRRRALGAGLAVVALGIALVVAYSRCYRGHHYLSDVVWGGLLGVVWLALAWWTALRSASPGQRPGPDLIERSAPITTST